MYFKNNQNVGNLLLLRVVSHVVVKMAESFAANTVSRNTVSRKPFVLQKLGKKNQSCCKGAFLSQLPTKPNGRIFHEWQINREAKVPLLDSGGAFKDYGDL